jgi:Leucine-rich repeat (LRR) protein
LEAKEYIKEGIETVSDWAKEIEEKVTIAMRTAWDEAKGNIEPIKNLIKLSFLNLNANEIQDISWIKNLTDLVSLKINFYECFEQSHKSIKIHHFS